MFRRLMLAGAAGFAIALTGCAALNPMTKADPKADAKAEAKTEAKAEPAPAPVATGLVIHKFQSAIPGGPRDYAMYVPPDYNDKPGPWPTILFLHGYGECGDDIKLAALEHGPIKVAMERGTFPFLVISPQCPKPKTVPDIPHAWRELEPDLETIMADAKANYRVDPDRTYLTGVSMGGFGSYNLAADWAGRFAAVAPICGGGNAVDAAKFGPVPFWIFHGAKDKTVSPSASKHMVEILKGLGNDVQFTLYPEAQHDSWTETYINDDLYKWMLSHSLKDAKKP